MERVEGGPDFKKNPHFIKVLCEVQTTVEGQESHPPLAQPLGVFGGEFNALVQERTRQVEKEGRETPDSPPPTRPSVGLSLPRPPPHTCELTHQVLQDKPTAHLRDRPPQSLYGDLEGVGGRRGGGPSVTDTLQSFFEVAYTSCPLPASGRGIFVTLRHSHHSLIP